jgi:hypothetical protein
MNVETEKRVVTTHTQIFIILLAIALHSTNEVSAASCGDAAVTTNIISPNFRVQTVTLPPQFTDMRIECTTNTGAFCATSLTVTDSTVVLDTAIAGEYTNLNDYNFLRTNRSIFPTFDNELVLTPTFTGGLFGSAVAISGNGSILAIGSTFPGGNLQRVDIYRRMQNSWIFQEVIFPPANSQTESFGGVVSLSYDGSILAIGTPSPSSNFTNSLAYEVAVFMYEYNSTVDNYVLIQTISGDKMSGFGNAIQLSATGQFLIIAEDFDRSNPPAVNNFFTPAVWVYTRSEVCSDTCNTSGAWQPQAHLYMRDANGNLVLGTTPTISISSQYIAISGDGTTIALGWPATFENLSVIRAGTVGIFKRTGSTWQQMQYIEKTGTSTRFGCSVSLSENGSYLAVGQTIPTPSPSSPSAYVFALRGTIYTQEALFTLPQENFTVATVSLSADGTVLGIGTGASFLITNVTTFGSLVIALRGPNNVWSTPFVRRSTPVQNALGCSIACSADGAFILAGASSSGANDGAAFVFRPVGSFVPNDTVITGSLCVYNRTTIDAALKIAGNIHLNGTVITGTAGRVVPCSAVLSDERTKDTIKPLDTNEAVEKIRALQPIQFNWIIGNEKTRDNMHAENEIGFIAQDIEKLFPQWVTNVPTIDAHRTLIPNGQTKLITIKAELYAYLIAALENLVERNEERKKAMPSA